MNLKYKFDSLKPENKDAAPGSQGDVMHHDTPTHARPLCLVDAKGKQSFFNYAYLVSGEYSPEENAITLSFTTHTIRLKGTNLETLFTELSEHKIKKIAAIEERYAATKEDSESFVTNIEIVKL